MGTIRGLARFAVLAGALALTGCNGDGDSTGKAVSSLIVGEYVNVEPVEVQLGGEMYRVFDNPSINKMMITRSMGWILAHGSGWTPKEPYEAAAMQHLANTGRSSCRVTELSVVMGPKHEAKYDCAPSAAKRPKA
jgi:hypothetical protein